MWSSVLGCIVTCILSLFAAPRATEAQLPRTIPRIAYLALAPVPQAGRSEATTATFRPRYR